MQRTKNLSSSKGGQSKRSTLTGLAMVPVQVKAKVRPEMFETYAFLDSGSNTSFCTESLLRKLNDKGRKTKLSFTTMHGEGAPVESSVLELEVFNLNHRNRVKRPNVYSTKRLPIRPECTVRQEDIDHWPQSKGYKHSANWYIKFCANGRHTWSMLQRVLQHGVQQCKWWMVTMRSVYHGKTTLLICPTMCPKPGNIYDLSKPDCNEIQRYKSTRSLWTICSAKTMRERLLHKMSAPWKPTWQGLCCVWLLG
jgi:hypothetical protein